MSTSVNHTEQPFSEIIENRLFPSDIHKDGRLVCRIMSDGWEIGTWLEAGWEGAGPVARKILAVNDLLSTAKMVVSVVGDIAGSVAFDGLPVSDRTDLANLLTAAEDAIAKVKGGAA
jgi:hypothetical protein